MRGPGSSSTAWVDQSQVLLQGGEGQGQGQDQVLLYVEDQGQVLLNGGKGQGQGHDLQMGTRARFYIIGEITRAKFYSMGTRAKFYIMGEITRAKFYGMGKGLVQGQVLL